MVSQQSRSQPSNIVSSILSPGILIIGSTNHLDRLDTSVTKRPSRFDRKYHFKLPEETERLAYCRYWRKKFADSDLVNFSDDMCTVIANWTVGFSFAYLKELFVTSLLLHTHGQEDDEDDAVKGVDGVDADKHRSQSNGEKAKETAEVNGEAAETANGHENESTSKTEEDEPADSKPKEEPRSLPEVPIPTSLQNSSLLRIFRTQAQTLLEEIDHSIGDNAGKRNLPPGDPPIKFRIPSLLDDEGDE